MIWDLEEVQYDDAEKELCNGNSKTDETAKKGIPERNVSIGRSDDRRISDIKARHESGILSPTSSLEDDLEQEGSLASCHPAPPALGREGR